MFLFPLFTDAQIDEMQSFPNTDSLLRRVGQENVDTTFSFEWNNDSNRWEVYGRDLLFYNQKYKLFTRIEQRWIEDQDIWRNAEREIREYGEGKRGKLHQRLHQFWNEEAQGWINLELKTYLYNAQGEKSEILYQQWRKSLGEWISTVRYFLEYSREGDNISILVRTYSSEQDKWLNYQRYLFEYDSNYSPPSEAVIESWNHETQSWRRSGKYSMTYNFRGKKTMEMRATWNDSQKEWIKGVRFLFTYDKKLKTEELEQRWDFQNRQWQNAIRHTYTYNEDDKLKSENTYRWNNSQQEWMLVRRMLYRPDLKKPEVKQTE